MWFSNVDDEFNNPSDILGGLPGGPQFSNVTNVVDAATTEMEAEEIIMTGEFTLMDAMSAIEIMDPRLDSFLATYPGAETASFNVYSHLTPEEVCWIMDRTICAEMGWHEGRSLSQTIYTCLYVHEFASLDPVIWRMNQPLGHSQPAPLVTSVLRSWIVGLVKCCHMAWREFSQRHVFENEDVISDKAERSLMESTREDIALDYMGAAVAWLRRPEQSDLPWRQGLELRMVLRESLLQLFSLRPRTDPSLTMFLVKSCRELMASIRELPLPPTPPSGSSAFSSFDPSICRTLVNHTPLPVIALMDISDAWERFSELLDDLEKSVVLDGSSDLLEWKTTLTMLSRDTHRQRKAFVRSRTTTSFTVNGNRIFDSKPREWVALEVLRAVADIPIDTWISVVQRDWYGPLSPHAAYADRIWVSFQGIFSDWLINYYKSLSHNRYRQRRTMAKNTKSWRELFQFALRLSQQLIEFPEASLMARRVPAVVMHYRLGQMTEILLIGFEADLYSEDEMPFLRWYLARVLLPKHEEVLQWLIDEMQRTPSSSPIALNYLLTQKLVISVLKNLSEVVFRILAPLATEKTPKSILRRRLEWAFQPPLVVPDPVFDDIKSPSFDEYNRDRKISTEEQANIIYSLGLESLQLCRSAAAALGQLRTLEHDKSSTRLCVPAYDKFIEKLDAACFNLTATLEAPEPPAGSPPNGSDRSPSHLWFRVR
ncbi:Mak10-domain-containing protein [Clavulina sp. PMI_390]|nr:Mak10-domain-containing protein [Clavulina sp. PMI_390]